MQKPLPMPRSRSVNARIKSWTRVYDKASRIKYSYVYASSNEYQREYEYATYKEATVRNGLARARRAG